MTLSAMRDRRRRERAQWIADAWAEHEWEMEWDPCETDEQGGDLWLKAVGCGDHVDSCMDQHKRPYALSTESAKSIASEAYKAFLEEISTSID